MKNINYSFEIVSVDAPAKCMVVAYTAENLPTLQISTRLPLEGEPLENVVAQYAPLPLWSLSQAAVQTPVVGTRGDVTHPDEGQSL